jgi:hypothetical protein
MKLIPYLVAVVLGALAIGCRSDSKDPTVDGPPAATDNKIQDVQNDAVPDATPIKLDGVIVTAIDSFGARTGNFYVQEPEGGPFSGVLVFGAKITDVATLTVGDLINIEGGEKDEFLPPNDSTKRTVTELKPMAGGVLVITKVGKGTPPPPPVVDMIGIAGMPAAARDAELEKWEGVPITVRNVAEVDDVRAVGGTTPDPTFFKFTINGQVEVDTSLAAFPTTGLGRDVCISSITGMGDYFFNYKVLPRSTADIMLGGTGCPAPEVGAAACRNGLDDDLDGFADCADFSCQQDFASTCQVTATISQVQLSTYDKTGPVPNLVLVPDVYVTAITTSTDTARANLKSVWISQAYNAAANEGVQVFVGRGTIPTGVVIGAKVDVVGTVVEFDNTGSVGDKLTEISTNPGIRVKAAPDGTPFVPITGVPITTVSTIVAGEPYEGTLMRFSGLKITALGSNDTVTLSDTATPPNTITMDDDIFDYANATDMVLNRCYSTVVAVASLNTVADTRMILPRALTDLTEDLTNAACAPVTTAR